MALFKVLVKKASTKESQQYVELESDELSEETFQYILALGLSTAINARMGGDKGPGAVTKKTGKELAAAQQIAMRIANQNLEDIKSGNVEHTRAKATKSTIPAAVRAEAMRLAKAAIKDWVRANGKALGITPSRYSEKAYNAKAKEYVDNDPAYLEQARINIEARKAAPTKINLTFADLGPQVIRKATKKTDELPAGVLAKAGVQTTHRPTVQ